MPDEHKLGGFIKVRITGADINRTLYILAEEGITIQDVEMINDLSVELSVSRKDYNRLQPILTRRADRFEPKRKWGLFWSFLGLRNRYVLLLCIMLLLLLTVAVPSRIYFVQVEDNISVPDSTILDLCAESGLSFGCKRADVRSTVIKNHILKKLPQLNWVGVTTSGCVATVKVRESEVTYNREEKTFATSIIAATDGVVEDITVLQGMSLCAPGQAVRKGQTLISGFQDLGIVLKATGADGEVYARTVRDIELISPICYTVRTQKRNKTVRYSLQIGKNIINFSKCSGISPTGCGKLYDRRYLTLPGGAVLPICLIIETEIYYDTQSAQLDEDPSFRIEAYADRYVKQLMIAGSVDHKSVISELTGDICHVFARYSCKEQIGIRKIEENLLEYGKDS